MSLDVRLKVVRPVEIYSANITHNLNKMAMVAGIYEAVWRPDECGITTAAQLVPILTEGIAKMKADPEKYRAFDAPNGWGLYDNFIPWLEDYLNACADDPEAMVEVSR